MKTIASVAIKSLTKLHKELSESKSAGKYNAFWKAWCSMRVAGGYPALPYAMWRAYCLDMVQTIAKGYHTGPKLDKRARCQFLECANLRVDILVMGGFKDHPQWEVDCGLRITP